jgi:hypothetical protein
VELWWAGALEFNKPNISSLDMPRDRVEGTWSCHSPNRGQRLQNRPKIQKYDAWLRHKETRFEKCRLSNITVPTSSSLQSNFCR